MPAISPVEPASIRRLLLIRPRFLGDVCLTLPTLDAARAACPAARVAYLVEQESAPLLEGDPRVDELVVVPRRPGIGGTLSLVRRLRGFAPDLALDFFCNPRTALWSFLSGAGVRVGYPGKGWRSSLYTHHADPRTLSAIRFHLASIEALGWPAAGGVPRLTIQDGARAEAERELETLGAPRGGLRVGFHPGARWPTRRWAPERFVALAQRFLGAHAGGIALVTGAPGEAELVRGIVERLPRGRAHAILGWPIQRLVALQAGCAAFVCGDTGPMHTAVAAGTPTLGLMSRNRPATFFPYPESLGHRAHYARVECSPCDRDTCDDLRCLERLTVERAWTLLEEMLQRAGAGRLRVV
jgi:ADP-heptose:LPS heptosyltransferase